jgi:hypothetical protein
MDEMRFGVVILFFFRRFFFGVFLQLLRSDVVAEPSVVVVVPGAPWHLCWLLPQHAYSLCSPCSMVNSFASRRYSALRSSKRDKGFLPDAKVAEYGSRYMFSWRRRQHVAFLVLISTMGCGYLSPVVPSVASFVCLCWLLSASCL